MGQIVELTNLKCNKKYILYERTSKWKLSVVACVYTCRGIRYCRNPNIYRDYLRELMEMAYDMFICCFQLISTCIP